MGVFLAPIVAMVLGAGPASGSGQRSIPDQAAQTLRFNNPVWSTDGRYLALTNDNADGVYIHNVADRTCLRICDAPSSGYAYNWSHDGKRLGYKLLIPGDEGTMSLQQPMVFDVENKEQFALCLRVQRAGVPSFANDGRIAYTVDRELRIAAPDGSVQQTFELDHYVNLAPISPDGTSVAYTNARGVLCILNLATGDRTSLSADGEVCHSPVWSPDGTRLVINTLRGQLKTIDVDTGVLHDLGQGSRPSWSSDGNTVFYTQTDRIDGVRVTRSAICSATWDGTNVSVLTQDPAILAGAAGASPDNGDLAYVTLNEGELFRASLSRQLDQKNIGHKYALGFPAKLIDDTTAVESWAGSTTTSQAVAQTSDEPAVIPMATQIKVSGTVPYIHQVYDTPNWFNGYWACGATSAMMGITYYGLLPYWDCTVSIPYSHVSHYGRYICEIYTYNGYTYNIGSPDPSGNTAWGGYGYIVRNDWADTKTYMRDYLVNHGLVSSVDWSPTFSELQTEVNNSTPFVLLNSLTTAGHYILTIGYVQGQYTAVFNDPYGNKNTAGYPDYYGAGVLYDWPGYNNGYANLNTVWCFIYCRGSLTAPPTITQQPTSQSVCPGSAAAFTVGATGTGTLTYQWQKNSVNVTNGGHYSGCTTTTLTVSNCDANDAANYRCIVTNTNGSTPSNQATLTVKAATTITQSPSNLAVITGLTAQFSIAATGAGTLTYQWQKNSANVTNGGHYSGCTTATLTISSASDADEGNYRCVVTADCGSVTSNEAALVVNPPGPPGDFDGDEDVDQEDYAVLQNCLGVTNPLQDPTCGPADLNVDNLINNTDVALFIGCMSGPDIQASLDCLP